MDRARAAVSVLPATHPVGIATVDPGMRPGCHPLGREQLRLHLRFPVFVPELVAAEHHECAFAAYLSAATVLVLDEATCRLDLAAEARAEAALAAGRTLIVIAHRIGSAGRARRILLLDGTVAQLGTHAELPANSPRYAELVGHWEMLADKVTR